MREKVWNRQWKWPWFGRQLWHGHDKAQNKSLDDQGASGQLLDIDMWQSRTAKILQDGVLSPVYSHCEYDACSKSQAQPMLREPDSAFPWNVKDSDRRQEIVHSDGSPGQKNKKNKKKSSDRRTKVSLQAKSTPPAEPKTVSDSHGFRT